MIKEVILNILLYYWVLSGILITVSYFKLSKSDASLKDYRQLIESMTKMNKLVPLALILFLFIFGFMALPLGVHRFLKDRNII